MIQVQKISKSFSQQKIIDNLSCKIEDNSIYGLVGANGAGKSTLLRLLTGIYQRESGEIMIDGVDPFDQPVVKKNIAFVPDDLFFYTGYTLVDYAKIYQSLYPKFDMSKVKELAAVLHLDLHRSIDTFSKGMKRQCALICAIATNAKYLFFDETFDGLDPVVRNFMKRKLMEQMTKQDTTIIMTSHNLRELEDICDHLGLLYQGGILFESEIDTLKTNMYKVQIGFSTAFDEQKFAKFDVLNYKKNGSVATLILKGNEKSLKAELEKMKPLLLDFLPLTLEEIFIYEMEVLGYEFEEMVAR